MTLLEKSIQALGQLDDAAVDIPELRRSEPIYTIDFFNMSYLF